MSASALSGSSGGLTAAASSLALAEVARERAGLYRLLATLFRTEPSRDLLVSLREDEIRDALREAGMRLEDSFFTDPIDTQFDELAVDFTNLFLLPGVMLSPHESVQLAGGSGLLRGPETAVVRDYYDHVGFSVDESTPMEPDHLSIELEFLGHLASEEAEAREADDAQRALDALRYQEDFLKRHLGRWVFPFLDKVAEKCETAFYAELARLCSDFLVEQRELLPQLIDQGSSSEA
ncbi:MAG: hypothetical protein Kow006_00450 [Gammaproteobacteria bacterium]